MKQKMVTGTILIMAMLAIAGCGTTGPGKIAMGPRPASGDPAVGLALVAEGAAPIPIVLFKDAPRFTRQAAEELAAYIGKISGATPELIEGEPDPVPPHAIWVGVQPKVRQLFPGIDFDFEEAEEIVLAANADHVVIAGRDRWDPANPVVQGRRGTIEGKQQEYGTANAVYTFIEECLGVRWIWPGELGEDVPTRKTIALAPFTYRYHPQIRMRSGLFRLSALGDGRGHSHDWVRHQRLQLDSLNQPGGHGFVSWYDRYHETHPDYFALQPDGTRSGFPFGGKAKICQSNPAVWERWVEDAVEQLGADPYLRVFNGSPNDSWNRGICVCENCRAWDYPEGDPVTYSWQGLSQEYVAMSDRYVTFANRLARQLKQVFPNKEMYALMMAYGDASNPAPMAAVPDENVIISSVHCFQRESGEQRETSMREFRAWAAVAPHIAWRPNAGGRGWHVALPDTRPRRIMGDIRFVAENHCIGIFIDTVWEHWATHGPHLYMLGKMVWNPYADGEAILADYYQRGFGPAANEIEAYWMLMEDTRHAAARRGLNRYDAPMIFTPEVLAKAEKLLDEAAAKAGRGDAKVAARVAFVRAGLDYSKLLVRARALMMQMKEAGVQDAETVAEVQTLWDQIEQVRQNTPLGFNSMYLTPNQGWMKGFHPQNPL